MLQQKICIQINFIIYRILLLFINYQLISYVGIYLTAATANYFNYYYSLTAGINKYICIDI